MQDKTSIARPYAVAAYQTAQEDNAFSGWSKMLAVLASIAADKDMLSKVISNPKLDKEQIVGVVLDVAGDAIVGEKGKNFVTILVDAGRLQVAPQIKDVFDAKHAEAAGETAVTITSAYELSSEQQSTLADLLAKRLGKKVDVTTAVDESLVAGVLIQYGDSVIDASVRGRLQALSNEFAN